MQTWFITVKVSVPNDYAEQYDLEGQTVVTKLTDEITSNLESVGADVNIVAIGAALPGQDV